MPGPRRTCDHKWVTFCTQKPIIGNCSHKGAHTYATVCRLCGTPKP